MSVHSRYFRLSHAALALSLAACAEGAPLEPESTRTALEPPLEEAVGSGTGGSSHRDIPLTGFNVPSESAFNM
jgi:hypothetical protein